MNLKAIFKLTGLLFVLISGAAKAYAIDATCDAATEECQDFLAGIPKIDADQLSQVPVKCESSGKGVFGKKNCGDFFANVENLVKQKLAKETTEYYKGMPVNWVTGQQDVKGRVPICSLGNGEKDKNFRGESCGALCKFKIDTDLLGNVEIKVDKNSCKRERAYVRGIPVQLNTFHKEKVFSELRARQLQLVDFDGVKPCAQLARDVMRSQIAIENTEKKLIEKIGSRDKAAQISCDEQNYQNVCKSAGAQQVQQCMANASQMRLSACEMQMGNIALENSFKELAKCEISARVFKEMNQASPQDWLQDVANKIKPVCQKEVEDLGTFTTDNSRSNKLNTCYEREFPEALKKRLDHWKTQGDFDRDNSGTTSNDSSAGKNASIFAFGGFLAALRRKNRRKKIRVNTSALLLVGCALAFGAVTSGCSGSDTACASDPTSCIPDAGAGCGADDGFAQADCSGCQGTSCSPVGGLGGDTAPPAQNASKAAQLASNVADTNAKKNSKMNENAATAATKAGDDTPFAGGPARGGGGASPSVSINSPGQAHSAGGSGNTASPVGGLPSPEGAAENPEGLAATAAEKESGLNSGEVSMSATGNEAGSAGRQGPGFGSGDAAGAGGTNSATLGASEVSTDGKGVESMDDYLARVGSVSLFEIVNKRYYRWGTDLDSYNAKTSFGK